MTKEITKSILLQQIQDKFRLRDLEPEIFRFSEQVIPTYDIGQHLKKWESSYVSKSVSSTGGLSYFTIPYDERWLLQAYSIVFVSGVYTVAGAYIFRNTRKDSGDFSYLDLTAAQSASYLNMLPTPIVLEPGDEVKINIDGYTSTGTLQLYIDFQKETIR